MPVFHHAITGYQQVISEAGLKGGTVIADAEGVFGQWNAFFFNDLMDLVNETELSNLRQGPAHIKSSLVSTISMSERLFQWHGGCQVNEG
jgi:hypothetical protein